MPRIIIQALAGRTVDQKRELSQRITDAVVEVFGVEPDTVTIRIEEVGKEDVARGGVAIDRGRKQIADCLGPGHGRPDGAASGASNGLAPVLHLAVSAP